MGNCQDGMLFRRPGYLVSFGHICFQHRRKFWQRRSSPWDLTFDESAPMLKLVQAHDQEGADVGLQRTY